MNDQQQIEAGWAGWAVEIIEDMDSKEIAVLPAPWIEHVAEDQRLYTFQDPVFSEFVTRKTLSGWWADSVKVQKLIDAFKSGTSVGGAKTNAKISDEQWEYFIKIHPDFLRVKAALKEAIVFRFLNTLNGKGVEDLATVRWYLEKHHEEFKKKDGEEEKDDALRPTATPLIQAQNVQINVNDPELAAAMRNIGRILAGGDQAEGDDLVADTQKELSQTASQ